MWPNPGHAEGGLQICGDAAERIHKENNAGADLDEYGRVGNVC